jgi:hypothetical protein
MYAYDNIIRAVLGEKGPYLIHNVFYIRMKKVP